MKRLKLWIVLFIASASLTLMACASQTKPLFPQIPANLMIDCDDLRTLETGEMGEALTWIVGTSEQYAECRANYRSWIEIGKKLQSDK